MILVPNSDVARSVSFGAFYLLKKSGSFLGKIITFASNTYDQKDGSTLFLLYQNQKYYLLVKHFIRSFYTIGIIILFSSTTLCNAKTV